ncbi:tetratricopeptide repeat protein [Streptomyces graminofaciens]|uniref:tetratricopeptide repeat protein n=1 Tax=Streptomyces graminofaciens TaxID=68212 RepID=UPI0033056BDE
MVVGEGGRYGGDHIDARDATFNGPFVAKGDFHQHAAAAPTAVDALPARVAGFTGRAGELGRLLDALEPSSDRGEATPPVLVAALSGLGGIGKTALAGEAAHRACGRGWFPGGVLFLDLHGYDDEPVSGEQALAALLRALGVEPKDIPVGMDQRAPLYRSRLAERGRERGAVLILADNASSPDQVLPLLPGDVRHRLLVTSRDKLPQLGARLLALDELTSGEAYELLDRAVRIADPADSRVEDEAGAAAELAAHCGHLPLALQIAAALLVLDSGKPVAELATELSEFRNRLDHLGDGKRSVRAAFDLSYRRLPREQARLLRLLALAPGPEVSNEVAAALVGPGAPPLRELEALARAHLVERGGRRGWWRLHDLVRVFGAGVVEGDAGLREEGAAARQRVLGFYSRWALAADNRLRWLPGRAEPERFADRGEALAWLDGERAGLVVAASWAREERFADTAVRLAACLGEYLHWRRHFDDWIIVGRAALEAPHGAGGRLSEAIAQNNLGIALRETGRVEEAVEAHNRARDLHQAAGDRHGETAAWSNLGLTLREAGRVEEAIDALARARRLFQAAKDRHGEATTWSNLGLTLREAGRVEEAIEALAHARRLFQAAKDRHGEAMTWNSLGRALRDAGLMEEAIEAHGRAPEILCEFEDWYRAGDAFHNLAFAHEHAHRPAEARVTYLRAADAYTRADAPAEAAQSRTRAEALE